MLFTQCSILFCTKQWTPDIVLLQLLILTMLTKYTYTCAPKERYEHVHTCLFYIFAFNCYFLLNSKIFPYYDIGQDYGGMKSGRPWGNSCGTCIWNGGHTCIILKGAAMHMCHVTAYTHPVIRHGWINLSIWMVFYTALKNISTLHWQPALQCEEPGTMVEYDYR